MHSLRKRVRLHHLRKASLGKPATATKALAIAVVALGVVIGLRSIVRKYFVESLSINGNAMYPTLLSGDKVLVSKRHRTPQRGEIAVYRTAEGTTFMKRVMALGWDTIEVRSNVVWLNGRGLPQEPSDARCVVEDHCVIARETNAGRTYTIALSTKTSTLNPKPELRVPMTEMFFMGDGRRWSLDSRMTGPSSSQAVIGTAKFVWWPPARFGVRL